MNQSTKAAFLAVAEDGAFFLLCLIMLACADGLLALLPLSEPYVELLERLHFNATYICLLMMATGTIIRLFLHATEKNGD
jgi:hypothetical protein